MQSFNAFIDCTFPYRYKAHVRACERAHKHTSHMEWQDNRAASNGKLSQEQAQRIMPDDGKARLMHFGPLKFFSKDFCQYLGCILAVSGSLRRCLQVDILHFTCAACLPPEEASQHALQALISNWQEIIVNSNLWLCRHGLDPLTWRLARPLLCQLADQT